MRVAASLIVHNELDRYLIPCLMHLQKWVDVIVILDDNSTDGTQDVLRGLTWDCEVVVRGNESVTFRENEGAARSTLSELTLEQQPDWVLAIDADEFVGNGTQVRECLETDNGPLVWKLCMSEVWKVNSEKMYIRIDGGWRPHEAPILWSTRIAGQHGIQAKELASGRVSSEVLRENSRRAGVTGQQVFHFGWTSEPERERRWRRYHEQDGGRFHASQHIASIMYPDERVHLCGQGWPEGLDRGLIIGAVDRV